MKSERQRILRRKFHKSEKFFPTTNLGCRFSPRPPVSSRDHRIWRTRTCARWWCGRSLKKSFLTRRRHLVGSNTWPWPVSATPVGNSGEIFRTRSLLSSLMMTMTTSTSSCCCWCRSCRHRRCSLRRRDRGFPSTGRGRRRWLELEMKRLKTDLKMRSFRNLSKN